MMIHPSDYRYRVEELEKYLSLEALLRYQLRVEVAYIRALTRSGLCSDSILQEYVEAEPKIRIERVLQLEEELKHDVKAMVEALKEQVSPAARPYCHLGLTSYDTLVNAHALLLRDVTKSLLMPSMKKLLQQLIGLARTNRETVQIGRTHGQHAEPTTFGFALANYVERLGRGMVRVHEASSTLRGKIGGAVGTRASLGLIGDPDRLEQETLSTLGLDQVEAPSQIANQEEMTNFYSQLVMFLGTLADLANDFRQLQRTEISEVSERVTDRQVGSSTMPQKRNPIGWENIISHYKSVAPKLTTSYLNLISEHQRDLTDSAANRYLMAELLNAFLYCVKRATSMLERVEIDKERMRNILLSNQGFELAEPLYVLLALSGVENAHEEVRRLAKKAREENRSFKEILDKSESFRRVSESRGAADREQIEDPFKYVGRAVEMTDRVCAHWEEYLKGVE